MYPASRNGVLLQRGDFDDDVKHGRWERWDAQGHPLDTGEYDHGRKAGDWTTYTTPRHLPGRGETTPRARDRAHTIAG